VKSSSAASIFTVAWPNRNCQVVVGGVLDHEHARVPSMPPRRFASTADQRHRLQPGTVFIGHGMRLDVPHVLQGPPVSS
jgi:hypothetical protein